MVIYRIFCAGTAVLCINGCGDPPEPRSANATHGTETELVATVSHRDGPVRPKRPEAALPASREALLPYVEKGIEWLVKAQHSDGGWGAGSHANQAELNPHAVQTDPATTAFAAIALLRAGNTFDEGAHSKVLRGAAGYLLTAVEKAPNTAGLITELKGTQIQSKLGPMIDTSMTLQFLSRALLTLKKDDPLIPRVKKAASVCIAKLQESQAKDGSWNNGGGWAPVLQSSLSCSALEYAKTSDQFKVDDKALKRARDYQKGNWKSPAETAARPAAGARIAGGGNAGIELYSFASSQRSNAVDTRRAQEVWKKAEDEGKVAKNEPISEEKLAKLVPKQQAAVLADAVKQSEAQAARQTDERLLSGFGNNGGEEYLSYLLSGESLVIEGGDKWQKWIGTMTERFTKAQNPDGSWSGHHCISSAVFCTSAVVQCATADRDQMLQKVIAASTDEQNF